MPDMLVNLLKLQSIEDDVTQMRSNGIIIRRPLPHELSKIQCFVQKHFSQAWADEIMPGFVNKPVSIFIAIKEGQIIGFGAYECTQRAFFGPTGVAEDQRKQGVGSLLLKACLIGLREMGYAYGIIGGAGPVEFYRKSVGAAPIEDSVPGIYADPLK
jgi:predicted N-acetyltransferase YhbS